MKKTRSNCHEAGHDADKESFQLPRVGGVVSKALGLQRTKENEGSSDEVAVGPHKGSPA